MNETNNTSGGSPGDPSGDLSPWSICPRCQVRIANGCVYFAHRPNLPSDGKTLARKVCQWAYAADRRDGKIGESTLKPQGCINPVYEPGANYGPYDTVPGLPF
jgi:hypothetical protein